METKDVSCAYSAYAPEDTLIDNDVRPSSHRGRKTEKRMSRPICLCPKLKHRGSPPLLTLQLNFSGGWKEVATLHKKTLIVDSFDDVNMQSKVKQKFCVFFVPQICLFVSIIRYSHISNDYCLSSYQLMPAFWGLAYVQRKNSSP